MSQSLFDLCDTSKMSNIPCIYVIRNTVNGKEYVGKTGRLKRRMQKHLSVSPTAEQILYRAIRKYGVDSFVIEVLEVLNAPTEDKSILFDKEIYNIRLRKSLAPLGYNMTEGGEGMKGHKPSERTLENKRALAATNPDNVRKFKEFIRQPKSEEHKLAIGLANSKPKKVKRFGENAPSSKAVLLFEKDALVCRYFPTQKDLAAYLEVDKTSVGNWLKGKGCSIPNIALASV